ncbi:MAG: CYTH and CHAD domain-containing protein [Alphaproteobacteria bacterium]|nr:CYTH and CHAD domain-containing protein [Alphaproteobacteria bacterium]
MRDERDAGQDAAGNQPVGAGPLRTEIELKLVADAGALGRLYAGPLLRARADGAARTVRLETIYFDTEDLRFRRRGLALRVRRAGRRFVQGVKSEDGNGGALTRRTEWEHSIATATPDLALIDDPWLRKRMKLKPDDAVQPVFTTRVRRQTCTVDHTVADGSTGRIEVALDQGEIRSGADAQPIGELELELRQGAPTAIYDLALALHDQAPAAVRVETRSKRLRGFALATHTPPGWSKAAPLALAADGTIDDGMATIFRACFDHWTANEAAALEGSDVEGVHQMRVALRRLRSAFAVFRALIPVEQLGWLKEEARWLIGSLGPARDADVFIAELLAPVRAARTDDAGLDSLAERAAAAQAAGYAAVRAAIALPRYTRFLLRLGQWIEGRGWRVVLVMENAPSARAPLAALADQLLAKRHRAALKRGRRFKRLDAQARHELRIALKKLRYTAEFFASLYDDEAAAAFIATTKSLQDDLGHLNDVAVAELHLHQLVGAGRAVDAKSAGIVLGWHARGAALLQETLSPRWRAFAKAEPFWHAA